MNVVFADECDTAGVVVFLTTSANTRHLQLLRHRSTVCRTGHLERRGAPAFAKLLSVDLK